MSRFIGYAAPVGRPATRGLVRIVLALTAALALVLGAQGAAQAKGPNQKSGPVLTVDTSRAGSLPATKAISAWNRGVTTFGIATGSCAGVGCVHVVAVPGLTTACSTFAVGCTYGNTDGSCTVEVVPLDRFIQFKDVSLAVLDTTEHELGHALGGANTAAVAGGNCRGLAHNSACTSIMQPMLGACGTLPRGPSAQDFAAANALYG